MGATLVYQFYALLPFSGGQTNSPFILQANLLRFPQDTTRDWIVCKMNIVIVCTYNTCGLQSFHANTKLHVIEFLPYSYRKTTVGKCHACSRVIVVPGILALAESTNCRYDVTSCPPSSRSCPSHTVAIPTELDEPNWVFVLHYSSDFI